MKKFLSLLIILMLVFSLTSCGEKTISRQSYAFDTVINITTDENAQKEITQAFHMCQDFELIFSRTNKESELYKLNAGTISHPSQALKNIIEFSLKMSQFTDGAFDITITPLVDLWNIKERTTPPTDTEIKTAQANVGYEKVSLAPFSLGGTQLDLGAVAKGYIADMLVEYFKEENKENVIIDLGGNIALIGEHCVGIRDPQNPNEVFATMTIRDKSAVTSGGYQRYFEYEGKRYHHIIDPRTGYPAESDVASVTMVSSSSMVADALSTSIYILGESALSLCDNFEDTDAIIIKKDGTVITTDGFTEKYNLEYK